MTWFMFWLLSIMRVILDVGRKAAALNISPYELA